MATDETVPRIEGDAVDSTELSFGLSPLGTPGLKQSGGQIFEDFLLQLQGAKGVRLYAEMEKNSATIGAIRQLVRDLTRQVKWEVQPNEKSKDPRCAKMWADHVEGCREDMESTWADMLSEALSMIEYGFAPMEITYKLRRGRGQPPEFDSKYKDGRIGWRCIEMRAQDTLERWEYDRETRKLKGMWQADYFSGFRQRIFIPLERMLLFRTESTKNNPEGRSMFRNSVDAYLKLKHVQTIEMVGIERDLTGMPVMEVPLDILAVDPKDPRSARVRAELERQLGSIKTHQRSYLIMPTSTMPDGSMTGYKFTLQQGGGAPKIDASKAKNDYKTDIFQSCLAQFLQLGQNASGGGSRALSTDQTDLFSLTLYALLETIRETFQRQAIDRLCTLNGVDEDDIPQLTFGDIDNPNLATLGTYITALNGAGVLVPDDDLRQHLYEVAGLPYIAPVKLKDADELIDMAMNGDDLSGLKDAGKVLSGAGAGSSATQVELLNGAQLASMVQVVEAMAAGTLPKETAAAMLISSLGMAPAVVESILAPVEEKLKTSGPTQPAGSGGGFGGGAPGTPGAPVSPPAQGDGQQPPPGGAWGHPPAKSSDDLIDHVMGHKRPEDLPRVDASGDKPK